MNTQEWCYIRNLDIQSGLVISLTITLFDHMRYYSVVSRILGQDDIVGFQRNPGRLCDQSFVGDHHLKGRLK